MGLQERKVIVLLMGLELGLGCTRISQQEDGACITGREEVL